MKETSKDITLNVISKHLRLSSATHVASPQTGKFSSLFLHSTVLPRGKSQFILMEGGFRNAVIICVFNKGLGNLKYANKENLRGVPPEKKNHLEFNLMRQERSLVC